MAEHDKAIFVGTVSYRLSDRNYLDFIRDGLNVNQLPLLSDAISMLQSSLDEIPALKLHHIGGRAVSPDEGPKDLRQYTSTPSFNIEVSGLHIESISFENGSVYTKLKIGAYIAASAYGGIAAYPDFKVGFADLRSDVIELANNAFGVDGAGLVGIPQPDEEAEIRYYFIQPKRIEEEVLRRRVLSSDITLD